VEETRRRIAAAAFELHATIGPSRTTIRAIADRAGVQRHTVYAHFPDMDTLYRACTEHGLRVTAMPDAASWTDIADPAARVRHGLTELFSWYRANERMLANVLHDVDPTAPLPSEPDLFEVRMWQLVDCLSADWRVTDQRQQSLLRAVVTHATSFDTWRSLTGSGLTDDEAVGLLVALAAGVAGGTIGSVHPA
jgi:AcrR family transcriptional regulator